MAKKSEIREAARAAHAALTAASSAKDAATGERLVAEGLARLREAGWGLGAVNAPVREAVSAGGAERDEQPGLLERLGVGVDADREVELREASVARTQEAGLLEGVLGATEAEVLREVGLD